MRKHALCICQNKYADQWHGNRAADQRLFVQIVSNRLLWLCSPNCVGPNRKTPRQFSHNAAQIMLLTF